MGAGTVDRFPSTYHCPFAFKTLPLSRSNSLILLTSIKYSVFVIFSTVYGWWRVVVAGTATHATGFLACGVGG